MGGKKIYIQYGCGLSAPKQWTNYDASPTLLFRRIPIVGLWMNRLKNSIFKESNNIFPENVLCGDIVKGLPGVYENSCDGIYCSHVMEHLSLDDFRKALRNTYRILKPKCIFRLVLPDLETFAREYVDCLDERMGDASLLFMEKTMLGQKNRQKGLKGLLLFLFRNSEHRFMWDKYSLRTELEKAGFKYIRKCEFGDSSDKMFMYVEDKGRFKDSIAFEVTK